MVPESANGTPVFNSTAMPPPLCAPNAAAAAAAAAEVAAHAGPSRACGSGMLQLVITALRYVIGDGDPSLDLAEVRAFQAFAFLLNVWPVLIVACLVAIALDLIKHKTGLLRYFGEGFLQFLEEPHKVFIVLPCVFMCPFFLAAATADLSVLAGGGTIYLGGGASPYFYGGWGLPLAIVGAVLALEVLITIPLSLTIFCLLWAASEVPKVLKKRKAKRRREKEALSLVASFPAAVVVEKN